MPNALGFYMDNNIIADYISRRTPAPKELKDTIESCCHSSLTFSKICMFRVLW